MTALSRQLPLRLMPCRMPFCLGILLFVLVLLSLVGMKNQSDVIWDGFKSLAEHTCYHAQDRSA